MGFRRYTGLDLIRFRKFANELPELGNMELLKRYNLEHPEKTAKEQLTNLAIGLGLDDLHRKITGKEIPDGERWENDDTSDSALPISDVGETLIENDGIKCITFDKDAQDAIPKHIRERMDKDRLRAKKDLERKKEAAFEIMAGGIMYKPKGCKMDGDKKRYKNGCGKCGTGNYKECAWD